MRENLGARERWATVPVRKRNGAEDGWTRAPLGGSRFSSARSSRLSRISCPVPRTTVRCCACGGEVNPGQGLKPMWHRADVAACTHGHGELYGV